MIRGRVIIDGPHNEQIVQLDLDREGVAVIVWALQRALNCMPNEHPDLLALQDKLSALIDDWK